MTEINNPTPLDLNLSSTNIIRIVIITAQIGLLWVIVHFLELESNYSLPSIFPIVLGGFVLHAFSPKRFRPWIFFLCMIAGAFIIYEIKGSLILLGLSLFLFAHTQLPVKHIIKTLLIIAVGLILVAIRLGYIPLLEVDNVLPVVGSLFMFRAIIYLHDIRHEKEKPPLVMRLNYFFLFPNLVFPLFPVVDYKSFISTYYNKPSNEIYQNGIRLMLIGVFHMILYRIIYIYFIPFLSDVNDMSSFIQYLVFSYLLILRLSGMFHLTLGILALFGMNLPKIFDHYFLANSFSDLWRRINIYWKDFMMKVFYYPIFFKIRKIGMKTAIFITILIVFAITWIMHSYQFFWVAGYFPIKFIDAFFWGLFGVLIAFNSIYQYNKSRKKKKKTVYDLKYYTILGLQTTGMFLFMCFLWSFWVSESMSEWLRLMSIPLKSSLNDWFILAGFLIGLTIVFTVIVYLRNDKPAFYKKYSYTTFNSRSFAYTVALLFIIGISSKTFIKYASDKTKLELTSLSEMRLNAPDLEKLQKGYYESMVGTNNLLSQVQDIKSNNESKRSKRTKMNKRTTKGLEDLGVTVRTGDFRKNTFKPNSTVEWRGKVFTTNSMGLRDKEYPMEKPEGTYRMIILGGSYELGSGVADGEPYESVVEEFLNEALADSKYDKIEILNFSGPGNAYPQYLSIIDNSGVLDYKPDAIVVATHGGEYRRIVNNGKISRFITSNKDLEFDFLKDIVKRAELTWEDAESDIYIKLKDYKEELFNGFYTYIADFCKTNDITHSMIFLTSTSQTYIDDKEILMKYAVENGFIILDLIDPYQGTPMIELRVDVNDGHPNALGHKLIAETLFKAFMEKQQEFGLNFNN